MVVDIGMPPELIARDASQTFLMTMAGVSALLPVRSISSHKGTYGQVLVIAGSRTMPGAAVMTAYAALRAGAGRVTLAAPCDAFSGMTLPPEIIRLPLPQTMEGTVSRDALAPLESCLTAQTTVAFGPGLTPMSDTVALLMQLLPLFQQHKTPAVVLDADGLNAFSLLSANPMLSSRFILTPHLGECARLTGMTIPAIESDLVSACHHTAQRFQAVVALKSASTVIVDPVTQGAWINPTGNSGMATAGSGDILTGLIAGFAAQGRASLEATQLAVYLHGLAGDLAAHKLTPYCMTATDILDYLPQAILTLQEASRHANHPHQVPV
jgi:NAD(P)H-hydrate epimerase